jgi:2-keto-4-pentenoate hydratase
MNAQGATLNEANVEAAAAELLNARTTRTPLAHLSDTCRPRILGDAYRIQRAFDRRFGKPIAGYKIGAASAASQKLVGASGPFFATVQADACIASPARPAVAEFFAPGVEAEYAFILGSALPARSAPYRRDEVAAAIEAVCPVIEICDNRFTDWRAASLDEIVADNGFFGALVIGRKEPRWKQVDLAGLDVVMRINGAERGRATCGSVLGEPVDSIVWMANALSTQGLGLAAGQLVPIGTWTGLHFITEPTHVAADFGLLGKVEIDFR